MSANFTFQNPVTAQCVNISTTYDPDSMDDMQFTVVLTNAIPAVSLSPSETTVNITNSMSTLLHSNVAMAYRVQGEEGM